MYRARFVIAFSLVALALALVAALALVPSYLALRVAAPPVASVASVPKGSGTDTVAMARAQALLHKVKPLLSSTSSPTEIVRTALSARPKGVRVDHVIYIAGAAGQMTLAGTASREDISAFRDELGKISLFTGVSVPVGSLVSSEGRFSISLSGIF